MCGRVGQLDDKARSKFRCTRPELPEVKWGDDKSWRPTPHMGRYRLTVLQDKQTYQDHQVNWLYPPEDQNEGCPGGWYRCIFVQSLFKYIRSRSGDGVRSSNPLFDKADDFVQSCILYFENEQDSFHSYWNQQIASARSK